MGEVALEVPAVPVPRSMRSLLRAELTLRVEEAPVVEELASSCGEANWGGAGGGAGGAGVAAGVEGLLPKHMG